MSDKGSQIIFYGPSKKYSNPLPEQLQAILAKNELSRNLPNRLDLKLVENVNFLCEVLDAVEVVPNLRRRLRRNGNRFQWCLRKC